MQRPGTTEHKCVAENVRIGRVLVFIFEQQSKVSCRHDEIDLPTNRMYRVVGQSVCGQNDGVAERTSDRKCAAVVRNLPLVIVDRSDLEQFAEMFTERED